jgi:amidase
MKKQDAVIVDPIELPHLNELSELEGTVLKYEFKDAIQSYFSDHPKLKLRSLADVIAFNQRGASREMPWFGQDLLEQVQAIGPLTGQAYIDAQAKALVRSRRHRCSTAHARSRCLTRTHLGPDFVIDPVLGDPAIRDPSQPAAMAGYPSITVPAGFIHELPVGIILFGAK